jgi:thioredoxin 1
MKFSKTIAAILLAATFAARAEVPAGWSTNLSAALGEAANTQTPVLIFFTASWCGPCKLMARATFMDPTVIQALLAVPRVAVDIDEQSALAQQHGVEAVPTFEILTPAGDTVVTTTGFQPPEQFVAWLTNSVAEARSAMAKESRARADLAEADQLLAAKDEDSVRKGAAKIFDLCAARENSLSGPAKSRLKSLAQHWPAILLDGLNHPRLATRIQVANTLRERLGDHFDVDPWTDAATRSKVVAQWREKLAQK